ncbi:MAG: DUF2185 domain-containing protein [Neisseria animaloris]|uniref:Protein of uncharacterized function (DUF2185) n=1 Tax=Neisseria animaloris TaxID=326522 RepID=A0A3S4Y860_9NEIS|nr:DUF2185 domain-containing protein [Neisseria animaloris]MDO5073029.1 DUF2185 domain-containing protein [Neisseria animaloris]VEJ21382.1 Protein of uncharacterised function (DUF2185) [Neisseria animaloris]
MNKFANALSTALGRCIASKTITENGEPVGFMYRESAVFDNDSGWRFFSGNETDEYTQDPDNFTVCNLSDITRHHPVTGDFIGQTEGTAWEADGKGSFRAVEDWQPED